MTVDIYIREKNGSREIRIPWLPEKINHQTGDTTFATYDILNQGEVAVPTGVGLATYSWDSVFPGKYRTDKSMMRGSWKQPKTYDSILNDWKKNGTPLTLLVTGYPINDDVYLEKYDSHPAGGFGDIEYEVSFVGSNGNSITVTTEKVKKTTTTTTKRSTTKTTSYTIKQGDNLWKIAKKFLGAGSKWETIYNLNKEIIESTAKKRWKAAGINRDSQHGHWVFPGCVIKIPA